MKKIIYFSIGLLLSTPTFADTKCFMIQENNNIIKQEGDCQTRYSPVSTFKIALSLMGYDAGILEDELHPEWQFKKNYDLFVNVCKGQHNPREWLRDSCVWYSRVLTQKLGMRKFKKYVIELNYGNRDVLGDNTKNNGLINAWLSSSLEISPQEQVVFLKKLVNNELSVSLKAHKMTKNIMFREELPGDWKLYGKTGNGLQLNLNKTKKLDLQHGWFVGWIEKDERTIIFVSHIVDDTKQDTFASFRARDIAKNKLWELIDDLEK